VGCLGSLIVFWPPCSIKVDLKIFGRLGSERGGLEHGYGRERLRYEVGYKGIRECRNKGGESERVQALKYGGRASL
jgi:hypothetical protein